MMINDVSKLSIAIILTSEHRKIYRIPRYQREYIWGQWNWDSLYNDIFDNDPGYFLGSIIVIPSYPNPKTGIYEYEVIDGQQRLTTISLLLAAIYTILNEYRDLMDENTRAEEIIPLKYRLVLKEDKQKTRVIPQVQNSNLDDYCWLMREYAGLQSTIKKPKNFGNRRISKGFEYFSKRIRLDLKGLTQEESLRKLFEMESLILSAIVVQIDVDSHADAYTLFASLNNRGVPLSAVDLIKNTLLAHADDENTDDSELDYYFEQWQEVLRRLGDNYTTQERFLRQNYDAFRRSVNKPYATEGSQLPLGSVATRSNLLSIYEKRIKSDAIGILDELLDNSAIYSRLIGVDDAYQGEELGRQLAELDRAQGVSSYLMLLYLLKKQEALKINNDNIARIVKLLVRFFVRRNVTDTPPTRDLTRLFIAICEGIEDGQLTGKALFDYIHEQLVNVSASDTTFEEALLGPIYEINPDMTRYILATLAEPSVTKEMTDLWRRNDSGNYVWTIEHIFPQGQNIPQAWVDMIAMGDKDKAKEIQAALVHSLGNLTLTGYNSKLSNLSFTDKRDRKDKSGSYVGYRNGLNLNKELVNTDIWTEKQIGDRTERLVNEALKAFAMDDIE